MLHGEQTEQGGVDEERPRQGAGLILLVVGSRLLVGGASHLARWMGVSELLIGLTVVAAGTSLPELATSFVASAHDRRDIAVGNVVGSNIFNALVVLGAAAVVAPHGIPVPLGVLSFDMPVMLVVSLVCLPVFFTDWEISRWEGALFLAYYFVYLIYLALHTVGHDATDLVGGAVAYFAAPLTALTLAVFVVRQIRAESGRGAH